MRFLFIAGYAILLFFAGYFVLCGIQDKMWVVAALNAFTATLCVWKLWVHTH